MRPIRIHRGSAKNTLIFKEATKDSFGQGVFEFLDYFSIFDWGRFLADPIKGKGIAMSAVAKKYFELLKKEGIKTHYQGIISQNKIKIALVNIPEPYKNVPLGLGNYLLPIEIIFRIYTHPESSDLKKIKEGKRTYQEFGYEEMPKANKKLPRVKISYATKLEVTDRVLTKEEARILAGLAEKEMDQLEKLALKVNEIITNHSQKVGLIHYDGKIEVAKIKKGDFMVVDVVGTLDEDRFMMKINGDQYVDVSKQFIRNWYLACGWKKEVEKAKKKAEEENIKDWKIFCNQPPKLPEKISRLISEMYLSDAEIRAEGKLAEKLGIEVRLLNLVAKEIYKVQQNHKRDTSS